MVAGDACDNGDDVPSVPSVGRVRVVRERGHATAVISRRLAAASCQGGGYNTVKIYTGQC